MKTLLVSAALFGLLAGAAGAQDVTAPTPGAPAPVPGAPAAPRGYGFAPAASPGCGLAQAAPPMVGATVDRGALPPPPPSGAPRPGPGGDRGAPPPPPPPPSPPPSQAAHFRLESGGAVLEVKCADAEPMQACAQIALQLLDHASIGRPPAPAP